MGIRRVPELVYADDIMSANGEQVEINGYWYWAKPLGMRSISLKKRLVLAWMVFRGECDALRYAQDIYKGA